MIPQLNSSDGTFTRATAIAWSGLDTALCRAIDDRVAVAIADLASNTQDTPLVVDCDDILRVADHAFDVPMPEAQGETASDRVRNAKRVVLFRMNNGLDTDIETALGKAEATYSTPQGLILQYGSGHLSKTAAVNKVKAMNRLLEERLQGWVGSCFQEWQDYRRLPSTPLLANGHFDARRILVDPTRFLWTSLAMRDLASRFIPDLSHHLTERAEEIHFPSSIGLLTVSLRASAFGAAIAVLLGEYFVSTLSVVDHVGPQRRIFERTMFEEWPEGTSFILVSDFIIGGSELRSAEALADFRGGQLMGAVALGTALNPKEYNTRCKIERLVHLPTCVPEFDCSFLRQREQ